MKKLLLTATITLLISCSNKPLPTVLETNPVERASNYCREKGGLKGVAIRLNKNNEVFYYMANCYNGEAYDLDR